MKFLENLTPDELLTIHHSLETVLDLIDPNLFNSTDFTVSTIRNLKWESFKLFTNSNIK